MLNLLYMSTQTWRLALTASAGSSAHRVANSCNACEEKEGGEECEGRKGCESREWCEDREGCGGREGRGGREKGVFHTAHGF